MNVKVTIEVGSYFLSTFHPATAVVRRIPGADARKFWRQKMREGFAISSRLEVEASSHAMLDEQKRAA